LHQYPYLISGGEEVFKGVYWGGNFESLLIHLKNKDLDPSKLRFFLGYSGWTEGQLDYEMQEESWVTATATRKLIFNTKPENVWKDSLTHLGGDYKMMINFPLDPQLN
jgi:putative transcriptional regulator